MEFAAEELEFLLIECGIKEDEIAELTYEQWIEIQERCADIEVDEVIDADNGNGPLSQRGNIAVGLIDYLNDVVFPILDSKEKSE